MKRLAGWALCAVAATCAIDVPSLPLPVHVTVADLFALVAVVAFAIALARGELKPPSGALGRAWAAGALGRSWAAGALGRAWVAGALWAALAYLAWAGLSAAVHGVGWLKVVGIGELVALLIAGASLAADRGLRDRLLRAWIVGAAVACAIGLVTAVMWSAGIDPSPFYTGAGELGARWRPAGVCRSGMLAQVSLVPLVLLLLDGKRLMGRARTPLLMLLGVTLALTLTRTLLAVPVALLFAWRPPTGALHADGSSSTSGLARGSSSTSGLARGSSSTSGLTRASSSMSGLARAASSMSGLARAASSMSGLARAAACVVLVALALASIYVDVHGNGEPGIRWRITGSALANAVTHPLFGLGPAAHAATAGWPTAADAPLAWDAHCTALDLAATLGLPALFLFVAVVVLALRSALRASPGSAAAPTARVPIDPTHRAILCALAATLFDALTIDIADFRHVWLLLALTAAATRASDDVRRPAA